MNGPMNTEDRPEADTDDTDDDFLFTDDDDSGEDGESKGEASRYAPSWVILVVDDDPEVHSITRVVLDDFRFRGRNLNLISAYSAAEAKNILQERQDIAVILLDVVMETDDAGLVLVKEIREELDNRLVRIILRTGQPGQAPEREVIVNYDINDYKAKTELTEQRLFTTTIAALRAYEDLMTIDTNRRGLEMIIDASASLFEQRSLRLFAIGVLTQLGALLGIVHNGILCVQRRNGDAVDVLAGSGRYEALVDRPFQEQEDARIRDSVARAFEQKDSIYAEDHVTLFIRTRNKREVVVFLDTEGALEPVKQDLIRLFCTKLSIGFDNLHLYEQLKKAQQATVVALADLAEYKDTDTGDHVLRVARLSEAIAKTLSTSGPYADRINDTFVELIGMASILHDVGKVAIPDRILQKPGKLDPEEWEVMAAHAEKGHTILQNAAAMTEEETTYLSLGAQVAGTHHEKYDGNGYPGGLSGEDIPLAGRIVAVADVYDALRSERPYKKPWPKEEAIDLIKREAGRHFDPVVVEAFLKVVA